MKFHYEMSISSIVFNYSMNWLRTNKQNETDEKQKKKYITNNTQKYDYPIHNNREIIHDNHNLTQRFKHFHFCCWFFFFFYRNVNSSIELKIFAWFQRKMRRSFNSHLFKCNDNLFQIHQSIIFIDKIERKLQTSPTNKELNKKKNWVFARVCLLINKKTIKNNALHNKRKIEKKILLKK